MPTLVDLLVLCTTLYVSYHQYLLHRTCWSRVYRWLVRICDTVLASLLMAETIWRYVSGAGDRLHIYLCIKGVSAGALFTDKLTKSDKYWFSVPFDK
jgi:hypothetical protein